VQEVGKSNIRSAEDLDNDFTFSINNARAVIQEEQSTRTDLTDDDILQDIQIENIAADVDTVTAVIRIITRSGQDLIVNLEI
jgi:hypothetical protein